MDVDHVIYDLNSIANTTLFQGLTAAYHVLWVTDWSVLELTDGELYYTRHVYLTMYRIYLLYLMGGLTLIMIAHDELFYELSKLWKKHCFFLPWKWFHRIKHCSLFLSIYFQLWIMPLPFYFIP